METIKHLLGLCEHSHHINIFTLITIGLIIKIIYEKVYNLGRNKVQNRTNS
jgi:ABC-type polysaccharide transport system permease subunit